MYIFLVLLCCGDEMKEDSLYSDSGRKEVQKEIQIVQQDVQSAKADLNCMVVFLKDQQEFRKSTEQQPPYGAYEKNGCKSILIAEK